MEIRENFLRIDMTTLEQIESFHAFATSHVAHDGGELSMDQLYCLWRVKHPLPQELAGSVAAIKNAFAEMEAGDRGRPARAAFRESCRRLGLVIDE